MTHQTGNQNEARKKNAKDIKKVSCIQKIWAPFWGPKSSKTGSGEGPAAGPVLDPIYARFWVRKSEFWRRPRALWCFTGSSFRDQSILTTKTKKNSFKPILDPKMATKMGKKPFRSGFQTGPGPISNFKMAKSLKPLPP